MNSNEYNRKTLSFLAFLALIGLIMWLIPAKFTGARFDLTAIALMVTGGGLSLMWLICEPREFLATIHRKRKVRHNIGLGMANGNTFVVVDGTDGEDVVFFSHNEEGLADHPDCPTRPDWKLA
ncbi:MAG: hypothetical protein HOD54_01165 [Candidatus Magasanikbacteria bacterium]|nr:hypothetical protein [Candidatus Magasanikbacteria bacterium]MBT4314682.1 hypothetical protein [Candidatus Magasanikbacteria bacterium]MBT4547261.1 hypothetical protein [Candidatus Magasanikbacteria bacterium]